MSDSEKGSGLTLSFKLVAQGVSGDGLTRMSDGEARRGRVRRRCKSGERERERQRSRCKPGAERVGMWGAGSARPVDTDPAAPAAWAWRRKSLV